MSASDSSSTRPHAPALTAALAQLRQLAAEKGGLTLNELLASLSDRGVALLMVVFTLPFLIPLSIPGLSTPFGTVLGLCGVYMVIAKPVKLPAKLGARPLTQESIEKLVTGTSRLASKMERLLHPRAEALAESKALMRMHGLYVLFMAFVLAIPFPTFPFIGSNAIAAWPIFLLGLGMLERDGLFVGLAYGWMGPFVLYWWLFYAALVEFWKEIGPRIQAFLA